MTDQPEIMNSYQAADYLAVSEGSLRSMRSCGYGPTFHREGRAIRYRRDELDAYIAALDAAATARRNNRRERKERGAPSRIYVGAPR